MDPSSTYPILVAEDSGIISLANYPLDVVLVILNLIFRPLQIITIDITGPRYKPRVEVTAVEANTISQRTKILLRPPPLYVLTGVCRLFQHVYRQNHPTPWGAHLYRRIAYHVDLTRDIFHVRLHRRVASWEWDRGGYPLLDPLAGVLAGVERMATSVNYVNGWMGTAVWSVFYLRHLNPMGTELMFLVPALGLEKGDGLDLVPAVKPLKDKAKIWDGDEPRKWVKFKDDVLFKLRMNANSIFTNPANDEERKEWERSWRLCPVPEVTGWAVDERRLCDPKAWGLYRP